MSRFTVPVGPRFNAVTAGNKTARSGSSRVTSVTEDDVQDPSRLVQTITQLHQRISELEKNRPAEFIEFERDCNTTGTISLTHNFKSPVRYSVVHWKNFTAGQNAILSVNEALSDSSTLVLNSATKGRAVIRVERAQQAVTSGGFGT